MGKLLTVLLALVALSGPARAQFSGCGPGPCQVPGGGGGAATSLTFVTASTQGPATGYNQSTLTWTGSVGSSQGSNKLIIFAAYIASAFDVTGPNGSVVCNGTRMLSSNGGGGGNGTNRGIDVFYLSVAGSTTSVTIVMSNAGAGLNYANGAVYWASGVNPPSISHNFNYRQIVAFPATINNPITVPTNGFAVFIGNNEQGSTVTPAFGGVGSFAHDGHVTDGQGGTADFYSTTTPGSYTITHGPGSSGDFLANASAAWGQ